MIDQEIKQQIRLLVREHRAPPFTILVDDEALSLVQSSTAFRSAYEGGWTLGDLLGFMYGAFVRKHDGDGWRVVSQDWRGDGQGKTRPR